MNESAEVLVPLIVFSSFLVLIWLLLLYTHKNKALFLKMVDDAFKSNSQLTPETIREIGVHVFSKYRDLRKGLVLVAISLGIVGFSLLVEFRSNGNLDLNKALMGIALFPGLVGISYLLLYKFDARNE